MDTRVDVVVIGAGISGLATAKCLKDAGFDVFVFERSGDVGGLWTFRQNDYGVMSFTHINVSKYNYCFSDYPFPDDVPDYPHNSDMASYIKSYTEHNNLWQCIQFHKRVTRLEKKGDDWVITVHDVGDDGKTTSTASPPKIFTARFVAICTGHHAEPSIPSFPGQNSFKGEIIHSVDYKDAITNNMVGKKVLVVGVGNSAVDAAVDCVTAGRCKNVYLSTRSGAWVIPNYIFGFATDLYACRALFMLPRKIANIIFKVVLTAVSGHPNRWGLKPKMGPLQTQPTVSPTLIHHIQRKNIHVVPNVVKIDGNKVEFINGEVEDFESIVLCTGYTINLPFLSDDLKKKVLDEDKNSIELYKNVFHPEIGASLAFIGFVQPASGGILTMSEIQARWFTELCIGGCRLPGQHTMEYVIKGEKEEQKQNYYSSPRHTLQKDPIIYNDDIATMFGAKPDLWQHPFLIWRFLFSSCGAAQWRLSGPNKWRGALDEMKKVPITPMFHYTGLIIVLVIFILLYFLLSYLCML